MKTLRFILVLVCCVGLVDGLALAQGKKKKKKKRKPVATEQSEQGAVPVEQGEMSAAPSGSGDHGAQDKPGPYGHELGMTFNLSSSSSTTTVNDTDIDGPSIMDIQINARYHYLLGQMGPGTLGVGPIFSMSSYTSESETNGITSETSTTGYGIGGSVIYYLGDIQTQKLVWFVGGKAVYAGSSSTTNDVDGNESSTIGLGPDGGAYFFLDSGVAIKAGAFFNYNMKTDTPPGGTDIESTEMQFGLQAGLSSFF